jgi:hypothetical protein
MECLGLYNKPTAEVLTGVIMLTGPREGLRGGEGRGNAGGEGEKEKKDDVH